MHEWTKWKAYVFKCVLFFFACVFVVLYILLEAFHIYFFIYILFGLIAFLIFFSNKKTGWHLLGMSSAPGGVSVIANASNVPRSKTLAATSGVSPMSERKKPGVSLIASDRAESEIPLWAKDLPGKAVSGKSGIATTTTLFLLSVYTNQPQSR